MRCRVRTPPCPSPRPVPCPARSAFGGCRVGDTAGYGHVRGHLPQACARLPLRLHHTVRHRRRRCGNRQRRGRPRRQRGWGGLLLRRRLRGQVPSEHLAEARAASRPDHPAGGTVVVSREDWHPVQVEWGKGGPFCDTDTLQHPDCQRQARWSAGPSLIVWRESSFRSQLNRARSRNGPLQ